MASKCTTGALKCRSERQMKDGPSVSASGAGFEQPQPASDKNKSGGGKE